ncbi:MAG: glutamine--fructose-6-phosphate transaminase (isomerizing) [Pseudomonadota bacterium]
MCGIVAAVAQRNVASILIQGLRRLEYRGYDSAGIALLDSNEQLQRLRTVGKVEALAQAIKPQVLSGKIGIAHTRWATHGRPSEMNAHPHMSGADIALVHNGIIENYLLLRQALIKAGYPFESETDTEIIVHLLDQQLKEGKDFLSAVLQTIRRLEGAFAIVFLYRHAPNSLIAVRKGSPLVIGLGVGENFIASDHFALFPVTKQFIYLEEGEVAHISSEKVMLYDSKGQIVHRSPYHSALQNDVITKGKYRHFMEKEIFEQADAVNAALEGRIRQHQVLDEMGGFQAIDSLAGIRRVQIVACGTSYHAGLIARYWLESWVGLPCQVEIASEFRYHPTVVEPDTLFITLSQSGETADTLEALRQAKTKDYAATLTICNVPESAMVRESDFVLLTRAGPEIGVASTKAFTTQLTVLLLLTALLGRHHGWNKQQETEWVSQLRALPKLLEEALTLDAPIKRLAKVLVDKSHALFIARGIHYPVALEAALKLKEISYIHAEAYPAGELKHGPLALVDSNMPVIALLPSNFLSDKLKSTIQEVRARAGQVILFAQDPLEKEKSEDIETIILPKTTDVISPIVFTVPLQLLAYHVAVLKGTDVDQPRNLAKSVTVE